MDQQTADFVFEMPARRAFEDQTEDHNLAGASELLRASSAVNSGSPFPGVLTGTVALVTSSGEPFVDFSGNPYPGPVQARTTVALGPDAVGRNVALLFEKGDPARPLVIGVLQEPRSVPSGPPNQPPGTVHVEVTGDKLVWTAEQEMTFRCGQASITLTRAGKVLIRGTYLLSRSAGVNRIKGGSVQIN